jgi:uncharacterized protein (DUF2235 family)
VGRQIVVCCDGTWNVPDEARAGVAAPTNVAKLALCVAVGADSDQLVYYEPGVGTSPDDRVVGGAFGYGLSQNIRNPYRFLAEQYQPGDDLFLFGFSRGAYTARSLAGLIRNCGLLRPEHADQVDPAFALYRDRTSSTHPSAMASVIFRRMYAWDSSDIHFIGVWDTVGALGIPTDLPGWEDVSHVYKGWERLWGFHDTQLSSHVHHARHALAVDEQREPFRPCLWTQDPQPGDQTLEQVWFSGVHSEIGGGSRTTGLSDISLLWLVGQAQECGLRVDPGTLRTGGADGAGQVLTPNYAAPVVDSRTGMYKLLHAFHRMRELPVHDAPGQSVASSAARRYRERIDAYAPPGFDAYLSALRVTQVQEDTAATPATPPAAATPAPADTPAVPA